MTRYALDQIRDAFGEPSETAQTQSGGFEVPETVPNSPW